MANIQTPFQIAISGIEPLVQFGLLKCEALGIVGYNNQNPQVSRGRNDPRWVFLGANTQNAHSDKGIIQNEGRLTAIYPVIQALAPQIINDPFKQIVVWSDISIVPLALLINHARREQGLPPVRIEGIRGYLNEQFGGDVENMKTHLIDTHRIEGEANVYDWEKLVATTSDIERYQVKEGQLPGMRR